MISNAMDAFVWWCSFLCPDTPKSEVVTNQVMGDPSGGSAASTRVSLGQAGHGTGDGNRWQVPVGGIGRPFIDDLVPILDLFGD